MVGVRRVGLVLSGGGAKGLAHIGVLEVLEELGVPVDVIAGNSMGSFIGALYSLGYGTARMETIAETTDWSALSTDVVPRDRLRPEDKVRADRTLITLPLHGAVPDLPANIAGGHELFRLVADLTWSARSVRDFRTLPIPLVAVATDIETGEAVRLTQGDLADAVRASMTLPGVMSPVLIDGRGLVDGMLVRNLPAQDAQALGADFLVCSDVSAPLRARDSLTTIVEVLNQVISFRGDVTLREERARCDVLIRPDIRGLTAFSFDQAAEILERGRAAARAHAQALADVAGARRSTAAARSPPATDSTLLVDIRWEGAGVEVMRRSVLLKALALRVPVRADARSLAAAVDRVRVSGSFRAVTYRLEDAPGVEGSTLVVRLEGSAPNSMTFGVRYESRYKASLLVSLSLRDVVEFGSKTEVEMRLGRQFAFVGRHRRRFGPSHALAVSATAGWTRVPLDQFTPGGPRVTADIDLWRLSAFAGVGLGTGALAGVEGTGEYVRPLGGGLTGNETDDHYGTVAGVLEVDTREETAFPTSGAVISGRYAWSWGVFGSGTDFRQQVLSARVHLPVRPRVTVTPELTLGGSSGAVPPHYQYALGGPNRFYALPFQHFPFYGLQPQELRGAYLQVGGAAVQVEVVPGVFATAAWMAGNVFDDWQLDLAALEHGFGLTWGMRIWNGSASATLGFSTVHTGPDLSVNVGLPF